MRVVASALWRRHQAPAGDVADHDLDAIPPREGEIYTVWIPAYEVAQGARLHLLWCPRFAEDNGWDGRPSDILWSQIVTGDVHPVQVSASLSASPPGTDPVECRILVDSRMAILDCMQSDRASAQTSERPGRATTFKFWGHVGWCGAADIADVTYLSAVSGEAQLELIVGRRDEQLIAYYEHSSVEGWGDAAIGAWPLDGPMRLVIEDLLSRAQLLIDRA